MGNGTKAPEAAQDGRVTTKNVGAVMLAAIVEYGESLDELNMANDRKEKGPAYERKSLRYQAAYAGMFKKIQAIYSRYKTEGHRED